MLALHSLLDDTKSYEMVRQPRCREEIPQLLAEDDAIVACHGVTERRICVRAYRA